MMNALSPFWRKQLPSWTRIIRPTRQNGPKAKTCGSAFCNYLPVRFITCTMMRNRHNIEVRVLQNKQTEWELMLEPWYEYFKDEITCSSIPSFQHPKYRANFRNMLRYIVNYDEESPCVLAWDTTNNCAAGIIVTNTIYKTPPPELEGKPMVNWRSLEWDKNTLDGIQRVDGFFEKVETESDVLLAKYNADKVLLLHIGAVNKKYRDSGVVREMTELTLKEAKRRGFLLATSDSTSIFAQKCLINSFDFEPIMEFDNRECFPKGSPLPEELLSTHGKTVVLVKRL